MNRFTFNLATQADDAALRNLLAATPMEGAISLAFARQPSYFAAAEVDGRHVQVGVVRDGESQQVVGMGSRAISLRYLDGVPTPIGYLSGLRLMPEFRGRSGLLARGYRFLRELHGDGAARFYLTTVAIDNPVGSVLTSARAGLPVYQACGGYHTLAISSTSYVRIPELRDDDIEIRKAEKTDRDAIIAFLNTCGPSRQFFPVYEQQDLFSDHGLLRGLEPADVLLAVSGTEIVGTLGSWDQRRFKQIIVQRYQKRLAALRPLYNAWATMRRQPVLPAAGSSLAARLAAIPVVRDQNQQVFRQLLRNLLHRLLQHGDRQLLVGLHSADPLLQVAQQLAGRDYETTLYLVYWPEESPDVRELLQRVPYLELGSL
jgi:hypothetical protein